MHNFKSKYIKVIIFIMLFIVINKFLIFMLCPKSNYSGNIMREMYSQKQNIDVAFIGSSYSRRIDPYIMDDELECNTFDYAFNGQTYVGTYNCLKELYKYHKPKMVILTTDIDNYISKEEQPKSYMAIAPYLKSFLVKSQFYLDSAEDGSYLKRLFIWPEYHVSSISDIPNNIKGKMKDEYLNYPKEEQMEKFAEVYKNKKNGYMGKGFLIYNKVFDPNKIGVAKQKNEDLNDINSKNIEYLKKIIDLCKKNNSELILLQTPVPTYKIFCQKNYFEFDKEISRIAHEYDVDYYNYNIIKPELFQSKDSYFQDEFHLNAEGSEVFTKSFADFLKRRETGEDMSRYFYNKEEYYKSIDYVNNVWFTLKNNGDDIILKADSFQGTEIVPEYQFILKDSNTGKEKVIRDYDVNPTFIFNKPSLAKYSIRVNARPVGSNEEYTRYYQKEFNKK